MRLDHEMHMIRHYDPGAEFVGAADVCAIAEGFREHVGYSCVTQPARAELCAVELTVEFGEGFAWIGIALQHRRV